MLLLNSVLTVEEGRAGSHQKKGWEGFTDAAIDALNREREGLVFLLWGAYAQRKGRLIDTGRHCVLQSVHPSPLSAHRGFIGCGHFSAANAWLEARGQRPDRLVAAAAQPHCLLLLSPDSRALNPAIRELAAVDSPSLDPLCDPHWVLTGDSTRRRISVPFGSLKPGTIRLNLSRL